MTKEELKAYISEAVDALETTDLEILFPNNQQPDLYSVVEELTGLKGAVSKLSGSSLKLNHEIHGLVEQISLQQSQQEQFLLSIKEDEKLIEEEHLDDDLKTLLIKLSEMDEVFQLATESYQTLPLPTWWNLNQYKTKLAAWQKGFDITLNRWQKLLQATNLYKTGLTGEIFNPELHEAVAVKHKNDVVNNSIIETEQVGFLYKGKVLRLAKVVVNKVKVMEPILPSADTELSAEKIVEEKNVQDHIVEQAAKNVKNKIEKPKPKPKRKKGRGGRRKKRKRNRK